MPSLVKAIRRRPSFSAPSDSHNNPGDSRSSTLKARATANGVRPVRNKQSEANSPGQNSPEIVDDIVDVRPVVARALDLLAAISRI